jgi:hypothetical protein
MRCSTCGFENPTKARFCVNCGQEIVAAPPPLPPNDQSAIPPKRITPPPSIVITPIQKSQNKVANPPSFSPNVTPQVSPKVNRKRFSELLSKNMFVVSIILILTFFIRWDISGIYSGGYSPFTWYFSHLFKGSSLGTTLRDYILGFSYIFLIIEALTILSWKKHTLLMRVFSMIFAIPCIMSVLEGLLILPGEEGYFYWKHLSVWICLFTSIGVLLFTIRSIVKKDYLPMRVENLLTRQKTNFTFLVGLILFLFLALPDLSILWVEEHLSQFSPVGRTPLVYDLARFLINTPSNILYLLRYLLPSTVLIGIVIAILNFINVYNKRTVTVLLVVFSFLFIIIDIYSRIHQIFLLDKRFGITIIEVITLLLTNDITGFSIFLVVMIQMVHNLIQLRNNDEGINNSSRLGVAFLIAIPFASVSFYLQYFLGGYILTLRNFHQLLNPKLFYLIGLLVFGILLILIKPKNKSQTTI